MIKTAIRLSVFAGLLATTAACNSSSDNKVIAGETDETPKVTIEQVAERPVDQISEFTATVEAFKTNNISSQTPNRIKSILVDVGSRVSKGQRLVVLDDASIEQLRVRIANAEREYNRALELLNIGGGTQQAVDQLKTELDASRRQYQNMMENTVLVSPISGVVTARNYDPGDMTGAQPILTIEQIQPVKVVVNVSESDFTKVKQGASVDLKFDVYGDEVFKGTVYLIHPNIDANTRTFTVEVTINNPGDRVRPGMFARVFFNFGTANHVVVPDRAVVKQTGSGNKYVYVFNPSDSTVSYNKVELGQRIDNSYELISGVADGALVVTSGQSRLTNGEKVDVIKSHVDEE